jgi:hypothetical protein
MLITAIENLILFRMAYVYNKAKRKTLLQRAKITYHRSLIAIFQLKIVHFIQKIFVHF